GRRLGRGLDRARGRRGRRARLYQGLGLTLEGLPGELGVVPDDTVMLVLRDGLVVAATPKVHHLFPALDLRGRKIEWTVLHARHRRAAEEAHELDVRVLGCAIFPREQRMWVIASRRSRARSRLRGAEVHLVVRSLAVFRGGHVIKL